MSKKVLLKKKNSKGKFNLPEKFFNKDKKTCEKNFEKIIENFFHLKILISNQKILFPKNLW